MKTMHRLACSCHHEYMDTKLGKGMRYANPSGGGWRCLVCSKVHPYKTEQERRNAADACRAARK